MPQLTAAQIVKKLSKPQRITLPSNRNGWVSGHPATLRSLERLGLIKMTGAGRMRHYVLTVEGEKASDLLYPAQIESDHASALAENAARTKRPVRVVREVITWTLKWEWSNAFTPLAVVPIGETIWDHAGDPFVITGAEWNPEADERLPVLVGYWPTLGQNEDDADDAQIDAFPNVRWTWLANPVQTAAEEEAEYARIDAARPVNPIY
jgi:hypothetical protein